MAMSDHVLKCGGYLNIICVKGKRLNGVMWLSLGSSPYNKFFIHKINVSSNGLAKVTKDGA